MLVLCLGAAYRVVVQPTIYTDVLDVNDQIYSGLSIEPKYLDKFGGCERTLLFYNLSRSRALINDLSARVKVLEDALLPEEIVDVPDEPNEPNEPNVATNDEP